MNALQGGNNFTIPGESFTELGGDLVVAWTKISKRDYIRVKLFGSKEFFEWKVCSIWIDHYWKEEVYLKPIWLYISLERCEVVEKVDLSVWEEIFKQIEEYNFDSKKAKNLLNSLTLSELEILLKYIETELEINKQFFSENLISLEESEKLNKMKDTSLVEGSLTVLNYLFKKVKKIEDLLGWVKEEIDLKKIEIIGEQIKEWSK